MNPMRATAPLLDTGAMTGETIEASPGDFLQLLKPRVMSLVVFTAFVGMMVAPGTLHPVLAAVALLCIAVGAGASGAINMWYDADIDAIMARTQNRPIPQGRIQKGEALGFGATLAVLSTLTLGLCVNWMAAAFLALTIAFYVFVYTIWLKRRTPQNIVIGGAAGALPPLVGWAAVTGSADLAPFALFTIIFLWTPPHFWALSLYRTGDYAKAGVPMLPVIAGSIETRRQIFFYSIALVAASFLPPLAGVGGGFYVTTTLALDTFFLLMAWRVYREKVGTRAAKRLFAFSILYLFLLFAVLLAEALAARIS